jgi:hypothetical protein
MRFQTSVITQVSTSLDKSRFMQDGGGIQAGDAVYGVTARQYAWSASNNKSNPRGMTTGSKYSKSFNDFL